MRKSAGDDSGSDDNDGGFDKTFALSWSDVKSGFHLACNVLRNVLKRNLLAGISKVGAPVVASHNKQVHDCKTQRGCQACLASQANGEWITVIEDMLSVLQDRQALGVIGFQHVDEYLEEGSPEFNDEMLLSKTLFQLVLHAVSNRINDERYYAELPPMFFATLFSHDQDSRTAGLAYARKLWDSLAVAETRVRNLPQGKTRDAAVNFLREMLWPANGWCRELLAGAYECDFLTLPDPALEEVEAMTLGPNTTLPIENTANRERRCARTHIANKLERVARWHKAVFF
jgi:hypothetical protein